MGGAAQCSSECVAGMADWRPAPLPSLPAVPPRPQVALFDVQQRSVVAELPTPPIKYAVWSGDMSRVALLRWVAGWGTGGVALGSGGAGCHMA